MIFVFGKVFLFVIFLQYLHDSPNQFFFNIAYSSPSIIVFAMLILNYQNLQR